MDSTYEKDPMVGFHGNGPMAGLLAITRQGSWFIMIHHDSSWFIMIPVLALLGFCCKSNVIETTILSQQPKNGVSVTVFDEL